MEEKQTITTEENPIKTKNKKGLVAIIIAIILLLAIVAGAAYYFMVYTKPENVLKRVVGKSVQSYESSIEKSDYKTIKTKIGANVKVTPNEEDEKTKEVIDLINALDLSLNVQIDNEQKQILTKIESKYENENLLNMDAYVDVDKKETYMYLKDLFDKYIETDMDDESYETLEELFENTYTQEQKGNLKKALGIMRKEFENAIKTEYCSSEKQDITIDGKTVSATKNIISMTYKQFRDELITVFTNLKDNKEFIDCYEKSEEVIDNLEDAIDTLQDEENSNDDATIKVSVYTTGILQNIVKVDFEVQSKKETGLMEISKKDNENYEFKITANNQTVTGNINIKKQDDKNSKLKIEIDVPEFGKVEVNLDISCELNGELDEVDTSDSIAPDEITQSDYNTILKNLEKTKLYELINKYSGNSLKNGILSQEDDDEDEIDPENENEDTDIDDEESEDLETKDNEIITYSDDQKIEFNIPSGYETSYKSDNYKSFDKDDISVKVTSQNAEIDEYFEDINDTKQNYEDEEDYKNVKLSDVKTIEVDGREFSYKTLEYEYEGISTTYEYRNIYICSKISDKNIVIVEVRDSGEMEESELKEFLKMKITDM